MLKAVTSATRLSKGSLTSYIDLCADGSRSCKNRNCRINIEAILNNINSGPRAPKLYGWRTWLPGIRSDEEECLPGFSTSSARWANGSKDPTCIKEAPKIENESILALPEDAREKSALDAKIIVPSKVDLTPISGVPDEHIRTRRVRIYQPPKNAMQSGTSNIHHWEMEFDNRQRWENPLMGWTSTGDPLSNMKIQFNSPDEAIEHCEKNGWIWFLDVPKTEKDFRPKNYGINFSWNRRTRVSTK